MVPAVRIGELVARAGVTPRTVRYYVAEGLLPPPSGAGPRATYGDEHLERLREIRRMKDSYLPLREIRRRLAGGEGLAPEPPAVVLPHPAASQPLGYQPPRMLFPNAPTAPPSLRRGLVEELGPPATDWRRVELAPGIELHYRPSDDPRREAAIRRLLREASLLLGE